VEVVPTPEENSGLLPYFLKKGILNSFRPCSLAAGEKAQKKGYLLIVRKTRIRPEPAMTENKTGFPEGDTITFFPGKRRGIATRTATGQNQMHSGNEVKAGIAVIPCRNLVRLDLFS
jgi:hypothetical protein